MFQVSAEVKTIVEGGVSDWGAYDKKLQAKWGKEAKIKEIREKEKREKKERIVWLGKEGKGEKENYTFFCKNCFIEYQLPSMERCNRCEEKVISMQERKKELMQKVVNFVERDIEPSLLHD